jgi:aminopeptidase N
MRYLFSLLLLCGMQTFAQKEHSNQCSKRNLFANKQQKSNNLNAEQIAQTQKYDVHFYALNLAMTNTSTDLAGYGEMQAKSLLALDTLVYELFSTLTIDSVAVNGVSTSFSHLNSVVKVEVNFPAQTEFTVRTYYHGTPPDAQTNPLGGAGMTYDTSPSWGNEVVWSLSQPFSAYEWWPCKQSLSDKADSCSVQITVPASCMAGSNGILENTVDLGNGKKRFEWKHRHPIDYYLISVAIAEYVEYNTFANPVNAPAPILIQNFIYNNPQTLPNFQADIDETADFIELFYSLYGPYPFENEKYGHCMAPISGGMEHQTMTTQGFFERSLTAHELGHQWWGDHVTCASWSDIWLNEGFASYSEYLMLENLYPGDEITKMTDVHDNVMSQPGGSVWVLDSLDEARIFSGRLSYDKGSAIVHTLRFLVNNDSLFFAAMRHFLNEYASSTAYGVDFRDDFSAQTGLDLSAYFDQWYFGEGFPTYSVEWEQNGNDAKVIIKHSASRPNITRTFTNPIELTFSRPSSTDTTIRFDITTNSDTFLIAGMGTINNAITIDPKNWIVNRNGTIAMIEPSAVRTQKELAVELFPNPFEDRLMVKNLSQSGRYEVYDMSGKILESGLVNPGQWIMLNGLHPGNYLIRIFIGSREIRKALTKKE